MRPQTTLSLFVVCICAFAADVVPVTPVSWFDNPANTPILDVAGYGENLVFLVGEDRFADVVHTKLDGTVVHRLSLPVTDLTSARKAGVGKLTIDDDGAVQLLQRGRFTDYLLTLSKSFTGVERVQLDTRPTAITVASGKTLLWKGAGFYSINQRDKPVCGDLRPAEPAIVIRTGPERFGVLNLITAQLQQCSSGSTSFQMVQLTAPELQGEDRQIYELAITAAASSGAGHIFVLLNPFRADREAVVLEFDSNGSLLNRYLCAVPRLETLKGKGNPSGTVIPAKLAVAKNALFLVGQKIVRYQISTDQP